MKTFLAVALLTLSACGITNSSPEPYGNCTKDVVAYTEAVETIDARFVVTVITSDRSDGTTDYGIFSPDLNEFFAWFNDDGIRCRKVG